MFFVACRSVSEDGERGYLRIRPQDLRHGPVRHRGPHGARGAGPRGGGNHRQGEVQELVSLVMVTNHVTRSEICIQVYLLHKNEKEQ